MRTIILAVIGAMTAMPALAVPIAPISYAMPNGDFGTYNYWDGNYTGAGSVTVSGAPLSGGLGALTDGVIATLPWYAVSNAQGTGQYVGWYQTPNPTITFNFAGTPAIDRVTLHIDAQTGGGVFAPAAILIDGVARTYAAGSGPSAIDLTGLALTGASHTLQLDNGTSSFFVMVSEVEFFGTATAVPEAAAWAMMVAGFGLVGAAMRRRSGAVAA